MKIKIKSFIVLISLFTFFQLDAQTPTQKVQEYGIGLYGLNSFSLQYRWGNDDRLFKLSGIISGINSNGNSTSSASYIDSAYNSSSSKNSTDKNPLNLNLGLSLSVLKIKLFNEKFGIVYGGLIGLTYIYYESNSNGTSNNMSNYIDNTYPNIRNTKNSSYSIQPYIGINFGFVYKFNPSFYIYADVSPNLYFSYSKATMSSSNTQHLSISSQNNDDVKKTFGFTGFSNSGAMLTLVYRIIK